MKMLSTSHLGEYKADLPLDLQKYNPSVKEKGNAVAIIVEFDPAAQHYLQRHYLQS